MMFTILCFESCGPAMNGRCCWSPMGCYGVPIAKVEVVQAEERQRRELGMCD